MLFGNVGLDEIHGVQKKKITWKRGNSLRKTKREVKCIWWPILTKYEPIMHGCEKRKKYVILCKKISYLCKSRTFLKNPIEGLKVCTKMDTLEKLVSIGTNL